jgi:hypothetical protein
MTTDQQPIQTLSPQIDIPENVLSQIIPWIVGEIQTAQANRIKLEANVVEWERLYEARPKVARKMIPWDGASNIVVPIIGTAVDAVFARIMKSVFGTQKVWSAEALSPQWTDIGDPVERWLNWVANRVLELRRVCPRWFMSCVKTGTGVAKLEWVERKRNVTYRDVSGATLKQTIVTHSGPELRPIPLPDFIYSSDGIHTQDLQTCQWVAERQLYTQKSLMEMETSLVFKNTASLKGKERTTVTALEQESQRNTGIDVTNPNDIEIWEVWASFDVDGDGIPEEIVINLHLDTQTVVRAVFNYYRHQERPFHLIRFMPRDNSLLGLGIAQMLEPIQEEVSTIHNQRLDNGSLSNSNIFKARRNSVSAIGPLDIYPGAIIKVDEPDDFQEIIMGQQHQTLLPEELNSNSIGEKRTGVNDYTVGRESAAIGSNATATSTLALIQEGNKRFELTISELRYALTNIAHQVIMLYQQFAKDRHVMFELFSPADQKWMTQFLDLPEEFSRAGVLIDTPAISEASNQDTERQTYMALMQMLQPFYQGLIQSLSLTVNPQSPPVFKQIGIQAAQAAVKIWKKVLGAFGIVDADTYAPDITALMGAQSNPSGGMNGQTGGGLEGSSTDQGQQSPMEIPEGITSGNVGQGSPGSTQSGQIGGGTPSMAGPVSGTQMGT